MSLPIVRSARRFNCLSLVLFLTLVPLLVIPLPAAPPGIGNAAPDFSLPRVQGGTVRLSAATAKCPVVLVVLRGYPGYQCPFCNRQVEDFLRNAEGFADAGVHVILVYPGDAEGIEAHAKEFAAGRTFPANFDLAIDQGYTLTKLYDLRWEKPGETAYPSTFLINERGIVVFSKISKTHGDRATAAEIIAILKKQGG